MRSFLQHLKFIVSFLRGQLTNHDMQRTLLKSGRIQIAPVSSRCELSRSLRLRFPANGFTTVRLERLWHYDTLAPRFGQMGWIAFFYRRRFYLVTLVVRFDLCILYEDNHLLVVNKPAGLATMGTGDEQTVHSLACDYLRQKYQKQGNVYLGVVHRLDSMSSGTLVLARTSKAAARLSEQFRQSSESLSNDRSPAKKDTARSPQKNYLAVVQRTRANASKGSGLEGSAWANDDFRAGVPSEGKLHDWLVKNEREHRMEVTGKSVRGAVEALLDFRRLDGEDAIESENAVVGVQLRTGRKHQIRVQFASRGYPVWGDVKYGAKQQRGRGIALHAWRLSIEHPTAKNEMVFQSPVPTVWRQWFPAVRNWPGD